MGDQTEINDIHLEASSYKGKGDIDIEPGG